MTDSPRFSAEHNLVRAVARGLRDRCQLPPTTAGGSGGAQEAGQPIIVATSGGGDSVSLLRALTALASRRGWQMKLAVGHVQHHLRPSAEDDARFVAELAGKLDLPFLRADIHPGAQPGNVEANARRMRYAALGRLAEQFGASYVVTAHHAEDQWETLLMRMLRGSSVRGLRGMAWRRPLPYSDSDPQRGAVMLLRPMLGVSQAMIHDYLQRISQPWRTDPTNADLSRVRARLRAAVLPVLWDLFPQAVPRASELCDHFRQVQKILATVQQESAAKVFSPSGKNCLDRRQAGLVSPLILLGLLRHWLRAAGVAEDTLTGRKLKPLVRAVRDPRGGERRFDMGQGLQVKVTSLWVTLEAGEA
ncbi:MAG: tRNA lysidine(34) synthetase TilS [Phycisphaeraceae bacterium]|nr:tRNA lysidine(34) synthetase TilS [Phycisphaeraceae bacterium]